MRSRIDPKSFKGKIFAEYLTLRGKAYDNRDRVTWDEVSAAEERCNEKWAQLSEWTLRRSDFGLSRRAIAGILHVPFETANGMLASMLSERNKTSASSQWRAETPHEFFHIELRREEAVQSRR